MAVSATIKLQLDTIETLPTNVVAAAAPLVTHDQFTANHALDSTTTPPVTKQAAFNKALAAGTGTIDLTALTGTNGAAVDGTGLKVQALLIKAKSTNTNPITIADGASNGYAWAGDACSIILAPGQEAAFYLNDAAPDIASGAKTIDLAGTGTESLDVFIVMG